MRDDFRNWLAALNLGHLAEVFEVNEADLSDLALLSEDDLKDLGLAPGPQGRHCAVQLIRFFRSFTRLNLDGFHAARNRHA